jgi:hypothetical protein
VDGLRTSLLPFGFECVNAFIRSASLPGGGLSAWGFVGVAAGAACWNVLIYLRVFLVASYQMMGF